MNLKEFFSKWIHNPNGKVFVDINGKLYEIISCEKDKEDNLILKTKGKDLDQ